MRFMLERSLTTSQNVFFSGIQGRLQNSTYHEILKGHVEKSTRAEAMQLEKKLKTLSKERLKAFIQKYK